MKKSITEKIQELLDRIADPKTPEYQVEYLERRVRLLQNLTSK